MPEEPPSSLAHLALEALPYGAAVLDGDRVVLSTNRRWRQRRAEDAPLHPAVGERFPGDADADAIREGVEAVLAGDRESYGRAAGGVGFRVRAFGRGDERHAVVTSAADGTGGWPTSADRLLDTLGDGVHVYDAEAGRVHYNEAAARALGLDERVVAADGPPVRRARSRFSDEALDRYDRAIADVLEGEVDERRVELELDAADRGPAVVEMRLTPLSVDGGRRGVVAVARDVTGYRRELRELEQRRDARETLYRVTTIVQELIGGLVGETRRAKIETTVVDHLDRSDLYRFAVVGRHHPARDDLLEQVAAGVDEATAGALGRRLLEDHPALLRTGEVRVVDIEGYDLGADLGSDAVVVPLTYGSSVYGLLCVGLGRGELTDRELSAFEVLGDVVGFAINAAKHRRLVLADLVTELEFRIEGEGLLAALSAALDCEVTVDGVVPVEEATQLQFVTAEGVAAADFEAAARDRDVERVRVLDAHDDVVRAELTVVGGSALLALGEQGATILEAAAEGGRARVTAAIPADENARALVETLQAVVPTATLVGKRDVERPPPTAPAVDDGTVEELTERQLAALETAYRSGYYDYPRESTAQEVAAALDIASPTLHQHLQAAHRKLLAGIFDGEGTT